MSYDMIKMKSLSYQVEPVIDHLSSPGETGHYIYCAAR